jgi:arylsulfatase A-like enzyme
MVSPRIARCFLTLILAFASSLAAAERPNIVFFLIDDLGRADCGFMGGEVRTPRIDALATAGTILDAHYVQPVCSPTRTCLMTGRYATRTGVYGVVRPHAKWGMRLEERTLANALHDAGYETAITGKWHLGEFERTYLPTQRGFDHQYGHYFGAIDYFTHIRDKTHDWYRDDQPLKEEGYSTQLVAKEACRLITQRNREMPLFLYVPFNGVHGPYQVPDSYLAPYSHLKGTRQKYAGMLAAVDEAIGQIVDTLTAAGIKDNTLIVFSADNGGPSPKTITSNGNLRAGKGTIYEGGVRVCAFAHWPGHVPAGVTNREPMHMIDWYPTLIGLGGGSLDQKLPIDGRDVWPMITQGAKSPHDAILSVQSPTRAAVRMGDWKLLLNAGQPEPDEGAEAPSRPRRNRRQPADQTYELYNLEQDIGEQNNRLSDEPQRVEAMKARLQEFLADAVPDGRP